VADDRREGLSSTSDGWRSVCEGGGSGAAGRVVGGGPGSLQRRPRRCGGRGRPGAPSPRQGLLPTARWASSARRRQRPRSAFSSHGRSRGRGRSRGCLLTSLRDCRGRRPSGLHPTRRDGHGGRSRSLQPTRRDSHRRRSWSLRPTRCDGHRRGPTNLAAESAAARHLHRSARISPSARRVRTAARRAASFRASAAICSSSWRACPAATSW